MSKYRKSRVDAAFSRAVSEILRDVKDPRVSGVMLSVLDADVTADFRYAKVYYSVYGECDEKELAKGLKSAAPYVRSRVASELNLRVNPEITFIKDDSIRRGAAVTAQLKVIEAELAASEAREAARAAEEARAAEGETGSEDGEDPEGRDDEDDGGEESDA